MKTIGLFEAKTHLSQICEEVAASHTAVVLTKRGVPLVKIDPLDRQPLTIRERREEYLAAHSADESPDSEDFVTPPRAKELSTFELKEDQ
jgi:prevent-host-death family protein